MAGRSQGAKMGMVTLNTIIALMGIGLATAGLWLYYESGLLSLLVINLFNEIDYRTFKMGYILLAAAVGMAAVGCLMILTAILGMCGGWKRLRPCIVLYVLLVIILILAQATLVGLMAAFHSKTDTWLRGKLLVLLQSYDGPTATDDISEGFNSLFRNARCCAVNDQYSNGNTNNDFTDVSATWTAGTNKVPATCCQGVEIDTVAYYEANPSLCTSTPSNYYDMGCWDRTRQISTIFMIVIGACSLLAAIAEIGSIVLGCVIASQVKFRVAPSKPPKVERVERVEEASSEDQVA